MAVRFLLGLSVAGVYPLCARTVANWMPTPERAFAYSFVIAGVSLGSSVTPPAMAWLMTTIGWREAIYISAIPAVVIGLVWLRYGADSPRTHPRVSAGRARLHPRGPPSGRRDAGHRGHWLAILRTPSLLLLSLSYFFIGNVLYVYVFWFFRYLIDVRGSSACSAAASSRACPSWRLHPVAHRRRRLRPVDGAVRQAHGPANDRHGRHPHRRIVPRHRRSDRSTLPRGGDALARLRLPDVRRERLLVVGDGHRQQGTGAATGLMNTVNNLGGVVSTALTPIVIQHYGWTTAFNLCAGVSVIAALLWLGIKADLPLAEARGEARAR
jgi:MFS transporter, ACS family, glucarate transporter